MNIYAPLMNKLFKNSFIFILVLTFFNCAEDLYEVPDNLIVHDFVWKGLNAYYLHQDKITDLSDRRFNSDNELNAYLNTFTNYNLLFSNLLITNDNKSSLIEDYNTIVDPELRAAFTNGLEFGLIKEQDSDTIIGYVLDILPLSYASTQIISRGDYFSAVVDSDNDTINLTKKNYEDLLLNYNQDTLKLVMVDYDGIDVSPNSKKSELVKRSYTHNPISFESTFLSDGNTIGYLMYNNDFSKNYITDLNNTVLNFKNQNINQLILDLRYNIGSGGYVENIKKIAAMITGQFTDNIFLKEEWNVKAQPWFLANQPDSLLTKFPSKLNSTTTINSLNLTDVYIVLNGSNFTGSSTIELLINSLKPYINVHIIGTQTSGNNTGSITLYNSEDYDFLLRNETHTTALQPEVLRFFNKDDQTYENGFSANLSICSNEDILNLGVLGETTDPILNNVLNYISTGNNGVNSNCNPNNFEFIYNTINAQREVDKGVFIKQDLPNTN